MNFIKYGSFAPINLDNASSLYIVSDSFAGNLIVFECCDGKKSWSFKSDTERNAVYKKIMEYIKQLDLELGIKYGIDQDGDIIKIKSAKKLYKKSKKEV